MSDRFIVQKKFNCPFQDYHASVLPNFVENWDVIKEGIQRNVIKMNDFFVAFIC